MVSGAPQELTVAAKQDGDPDGEMSESDIPQALLPLGFRSQLRTEEGTAVIALELPDD